MPKDACYHKVKARYKVFPSAYASGAIAKCRKVGAANYGTGGKKENKEGANGAIMPASMVSLKVKHLYSLKNMPLLCKITQRGYEKLLE